jgi:hypothetical protein
MQPQALGRDPLSCQEFLEGHSDYLDGLLPAGAARFYDEHVAGCESCNRFDRVLRRGLLLAHNLPEIQPSANFQDKLQARLMRLEDESPLQRPVMAGTGTAVVIAAVLGVIALTPFVMRESTVQAPQPIVAEHVHITPAAPMRINLSAFGEPEIPAATFPTSPLETDFSPVIVQPPAVQVGLSAPRITYPLLQQVER